MLLTAVALRRSLASARPWLAVLAVACIAEIWDMSDDLVAFGRLRWEASLHDLINTLIWPTILLFLARSGALGFCRPGEKDESRPTSPPEPIADEGAA
jgi:hypothetical protein